MSGARLELDGVSKQFRGLRAVHDVSFTVPAGAIHALIGPNGAGKTTIFNMIAGALAPNGGVVRLDGRVISGLRPDRICDAGVGRTFQLVKPFKGLSVLENVTVGALHRKAHLAEAQDSAAAILSRLGLYDRRHRLAESLTLPDRKRLEVARALATEPKLLLLDEVMAGLRPTEVDVMVGFLRELNRQSGLTILLIEHVMRAVMALAAEVVVVSYGEKIAEGTPQEITRHQAVLDVYLGEQEAL
jgi:branched-chain amino acid transport system ATP-binding protein